MGLIFCSQGTQRKAGVYEDDWIGKNSIKESRKNTQQ